MGRHGGASSIAVVSKNWFTFASTQVVKSIYTSPKSPFCSPKVSRKKRSCQSEESQKKFFSKKVPLVCGFWAAGVTKVSLKISVTCVWVLGSHQSHKSFSQKKCYLCAGLGQSPESQKFLSKKVTCVWVLGSRGQF